LETLTDDGEKDNQLMASNGWSKQPYTRFGIHTMVKEGHSGIREEGTVRNDYRYV